MKLFGRMIGTQNPSARAARQSSSASILACPYGPTPISSSSS